MAPRKTTFSAKHDPARQRLAELIDPSHRLVGLAELIDPSHRLVGLAAVIDWAALKACFGLLYVARVGRPGVPIRLMAGLHYLKHAFDLSDQEVVERWVENPSDSTCAASRTSSKRGVEAVLTLVRQGLLISSM